MEDTKDYLIALSAGKTLKKVNMKNYSKSSKNIGDGSTLFDIHTTLLQVKATDTVLVFTDRGNCIKTTVDKLPECKWREKGVTLKQLDKSIDIMETPVAVVKVEGDGEIVFFTQKGMVKRSEQKDLIVAKSFYQVLKVAEDDKVLNVEKEVKGKTFVMLTKNGYCVNFEKNEVPIQGRVSGGVKGVNLEENDCVVYAGQNLSNDFLIVTNNGYVKRLNALSIPICARYRKGVKYINFEKNGKAVAYAGIKARAVIDHGLKFTILQATDYKISNDRLSCGQEEVKKRFLGVYDFVD